MPHAAEYDMGWMGAMMESSLNHHSLGKTSTSRDIDCKDGNDEIR